MSIAAIIALVTGLIGFLNRVWPDKPTPAQKAQAEIGKNQEQEDAFRKDRDTTHLGDFN